MSVASIRLGYNMCIAVALVLVGSAVQVTEVHVMDVHN